MHGATEPQRTLCFITGNKGKLSEVQSILGASSLQIASLKLDLPELQGPTAEYIVREKAKTAFAAAAKQRVEVDGGAAATTASGAPMPVMIEDTSLGFDSMGGNLPGPYIKWFLDGIGPHGLSKIASALGNGGVGQPGHSGTLATASCIFTIAFAEDDIRLFEGRCKGNIVPPRGANGFGWDCVFEPLEQADAAHPKTFAEMTAEEKNRISHRARALEQLKLFFDGSTKASPSTMKRAREESNA